eukprot:7168263-Pyramimonas_sp.AAC.1
MSKSDSLLAQLGAERQQRLQEVLRAAVEAVPVGGGPGGQHLGAHMRGVLVPARLKHNRPPCSNAHPTPCINK